MNTYSLRAEAQADIDSFMTAMASAAHRINGYTITAEPDDFDVLMEFNTPADLADILAVINQVPDGHVMYRSLQAAPLASADFTRDHR